MLTFVHPRTTVERLVNRKRVDITPMNYLRRFSIHLTIYVLLSLGISGAIIVTQGLTYPALFSSVALSLSSIALWTFFRSRTKSVAVKGDTLILNSYHNHSLVTSLRSIKDVHTTRIPGVHITRLNFKLDGVNRSALVINRSWAVPSTPERMIRKAIALSKKERNKKGKP